MHTCDLCGDTGTVTAEYTNHYGDIVVWTLCSEHEWYVAILGTTTEYA